MKLLYEEEALCRERINGCDLLLAGWMEDPELIFDRLESGKPAFRISERIYREGQWKAVSPWGLASKYKEHIRYRNRAGVPAVRGRICGIRFYPDPRLSRKNAPLRLFSGDEGSVPAGGKAAGGSGTASVGGQADAPEASGVCRPTGGGAARSGL